MLLREVAYARPRSVDDALRLLQTHDGARLVPAAIAALLGKWFWWPTHVRQRPKPAPWPSPPNQPETVPTA